MKKILKITKCVKAILEEKPETRDDDNLLWREVIIKAEDESGLLISRLTVEYVLANINRLNLPTFESVSRVRRKLQEKYPELRGSENARRGRAKKEQKFKEFARL